MFQITTPISITMLAKHINSVSIPKNYVHSYKIQTSIEAVQWLAAMHNLAIQ